MIKVSIVLPTYKPASYIYECLSSIDKQTLDKSDFELVIILNGCNEPYKTELDNYISHNLSGDLNINFIQTDQGGVSNARNIGIEQSKGDYITFIDDDDYISPSYIEELLKNASPDVVSLSNTIAFDDETGEHDENYRISKAFDENKTTNINGARKYFSGPWAKLIHKDIIGYRRFDVNFRIGEDSLFMFLISDRIRKCKFTSSQAVYYRRNRGSSAINNRGSRQEIAINQFNMIKNYSNSYIKNPLRYNLFFFITRIIAAVKVYMIKILIN